MGFIRTMLGDIAPEDLGFTYSHEHIVCRPPHWAERGEQDLLLDDPAKSQNEVALFKAAGGRSIVDATAVDYGRFNITGNEEDRYFFKVPSLRNVALTPPYLHDGSARDLNEVVTIMARYQLALNLAAPDVARIVAFLGTLTGEYQGRPLE